MMWIRTLPDCLAASRAIAAGIAQAFGFASLTQMLDTFIGAAPALAR